MTIAQKLSKNSELVKPRGIQFLESCTGFPAQLIGPDLFAIRVAADWDSCAAIFCLTHNDRRFQRRLGFETCAIDQPFLGSKVRLTGKWVGLDQIMDVWGSPGLLVAGIMRWPGGELILEGVHFIARSGLDVNEPYYN